VVDLVDLGSPCAFDDLVRYACPLTAIPTARWRWDARRPISVPRIVHVKGDGAGAAISATLAARAAEANSITLLEGFHAIELAMEHGRVTGIFARSGLGPDARLILFRARAVILATGGLGALYAVTTNPLEARGEGLGMAARAGALIADPEFVQFHPTAIAIGRDPAPLATEALRGEGSVLVNGRGERFMTAIHKDAELAPRDIVARAIHRQITSGEKVFLDCRQAIGAEFPHHFPTVHAACMSAGIDPVRDLIPVAPAAHYHMGGIASDVHRPLLPAGPVGGGRMRLHRLAWRQPAGVQLAARRIDLWRAHRRRRARTASGRRDARSAASPPTLCLARAAAHPAHRHEPRCGAGNAMRKVCARPWA
jgi:L-aspartate oxidase